MLVKTIQILWHEKEPVFSVDCDLKANGVKRVATAGADCSIKIWGLNHLDPEKPLFEFLSSLNRHSGSVNSVRWHPFNGTLASGGDDGVILLWIRTPELNNDGKEVWKPGLALRSSSSDVYDLAWSPCGNYIVAASTDYSVRVFEVSKYRCIYLLSNHCNYVQGLCFDPIGEYIVSQSCDQSVIVYNCKMKNSKMKIPKVFAKLKRAVRHEEYSRKLYHDDSLTSFFRRPAFSPDGLILVTPSGCGCVFDVSDTELNTNSTYIYGRSTVKNCTPLLQLPIPNNRPSIGVRFSPVPYKLREGKSLIPLPYRFMFAVICQDTILVYDTQQEHPIAVVSELHYAALTDVSWSSDGLLLIVTSIDGFCSVISFQDMGLGEKWEGGYLLPESL